MADADKTDTFYFTYFSAGDKHPLTLDAHATLAIQ